MEVLRAMNGFQAQFLSNALHAMRLRSGKRLLVTQFRPFSQEERGLAEAAAARLWGEAVRPVFQNA